MADLDSVVSELQQHIDEKALETYGKEVVDRWQRPPNMGRPPKAEFQAELTGQCGDTMRIFLCIEEGTIMDAGFFTDGCVSSMACGSMAAQLAKGMQCENITAITGEMVLEQLGALPEEDQHCARLAANTLHEAVGDYYKRLKNGDDQLL